MGQKAIDVWEADTRGRDHFRAYPKDSDVSRQPAKIGAIPLQISRSRLDWLRIAMDVKQAAGYCEYMLAIWFNNPGRSRGGGGCSITTTNWW